MKKSLPWRRAVIILLAPLILLLIWAGITPPVSVSAFNIDDFDFNRYNYEYEIVKYDVKMDVAQTREITVTENISVVFYVTSSGIIRDFPLESGLRYHNLSALRDGTAVESHITTEDSDFLSFYIGRKGKTLYKDKTYIYTISYKMTVPALKETGYLPLNLVGYGWEVPISNFTATITVPDGLEDHEVYSGPTGNFYKVSFEQWGNTVYLAAEDLGTSGVTLDLSFASGVLKASSDPALIWAILLAAGLLLLAMLLKILFCRQPLIVKSVSLDAPKGMDPLLMGALIDGKIDSEDLGALVFWLAAKGYLKIDLTENDEDPTLIRIFQKLPEDTPRYITVFFEGLFKHGDTVRVSSLEYTFYTTAEAVKDGVNAKKGKLYKAQGTAIFCILWALTTILLGGFALAYGMIHVASTYYYGILIPLCFFAFLASAVGCTFAWTQSFKWKRGKQVLIASLGIVGSILVGLLSLVFNSAAFGAITGLILTESSAILGVVASFCGVRSDEYSQKLGHILGFKDFILYTEKDRIQFMLKENPELYYNILPYAQVLGVSEAWTGKFEGLSFEPPSYINCRGSFVINLLVWNTMFHAFNHGFARAFANKPSSKGAFGGHGGGFGGGFGGGGFGGGGGRRF